VIYEYDSKALAKRFMASTPTANFGIPTIKEVSGSVDGTGLELSGFFATWDVDSQDESFHPSAFNTSLPRALKLGIPVLYNHLKNEAPIGFVKSCEVQAGGLFGSIILPKPALGTKAYDVYSAIQNGSMGNVSFSVGGLWRRFDVGGKVKLICERLLECSVTPLATNQFAVSTGVQAAVGVKSLGGGSGPDALWLPQTMSSKAKAEARTRYMAHRRLEKALDMLDLELTVRSLNVARSRALALQPLV